MPVRGRFMLGKIEVVIGFRTDGQLSLYWDQDPVFSFDADGRLRRVFFDSDRFKAVDGSLIRLRPPNSSPAPSPAPSHSAVRRLRLRGESIGEDDQSRILQKLDVCLQQIRSALAHPPNERAVLQLQTVGQTEVDYCDRVLSWIDRLNYPVPIGSVPNA